MKTRAGFVSNSSSSSFCIYGAAVSESQLRPFLFPGTDVDSDDYDEDVFGAVEEKAEKAGLEYHYPEGYDCWYIGKNPNECQDNQTMGDFKKEVEKLLKDNFGIESDDCENHQEAYYS